MNTVDYEVLVLYLSISIFLLLYTVRELFILLLLLGKCSFYRTILYYNICLQIYTSHLIHKDLHCCRGKSNHEKKTKYCVEGLIFLIIGLLFTYIGLLIQ